jgi:hypothetical protein
MAQAEACKYSLEAKVLGISMAAVLNEEKLLQDCDAPACGGESVQNCNGIQTEAVGKVACRCNACML